MKKLAIVCGSPSSEFLAPFSDESFDIWVLGNRINRFDGKRVTRIFEIHDDLSEHGDATKYAEYLASKNVPMVVGAGFPIKADHIKVFDFESASRLIGQTYLTSSPAYMMAQAIMDGYDEIGIYGVDLAVDDHEYFWQRPCMEYWIGYAKGLGIKVVIPEVSAIGKASYIEGAGCGGKPKFAKPPFTEMAFKQLEDMHQKKIDEYFDKIRNLEKMIQTHDGLRQAYARMAKVARAVEAGVDNIDLLNTVSLK